MSSVVKVIELISEGESIDAAIKSAVIEASRTIQEIRQVNVEHIEARVEKNKVTKFRVNVKVSFVVDLQQG